MSSWKDDLGAKHIDLRKQILNWLGEKRLLLKTSSGLVFFLGVPDDQEVEGTAPRKAPQQMGEGLFLPFNRLPGVFLFEHASGR